MVSKWSEVLVNMSYFTCSSFRSSRITSSYSSFSLAGFVSSNLITSLPLKASL